MIFSILPIGFDGFSQAAPNLENNHHGVFIKKIVILLKYKQGIWTFTLWKVTEQFFVSTILFTDSVGIQL